MLVAALLGVPGVWALGMSVLQDVSIDRHAPATAHDALPGLEADDLRVNLNAAEIAELQLLPGVGPVLAERIVAHRSRHGTFDALGDLDAVYGVGEHTLQRLAASVVIGPDQRHE